MKHVSIGSWITLGQPAITEIMADSGFDWLCIDMEHSVIDFREMQNLICAIQGKNVSAWVRVGQNQDLLIKKALDAGADGIIVPMVHSREEAQKAVDSAFYPPAGRRGVGLARAQGYGHAFKNYRDSRAKKIQVIVQIEHIQAIDHLEEIIDVQGVAGALIGPYDLSGSLGVPGQFDHPDMIRALKRFETVLKKSKKKMGFHVISPDSREIQKKVKKGYNFLGFSLDTLFLGQKCKDELKKLGRK